MVGLPLPNEHVISPHYRRLRESLADQPKRWLITGVAGFIGSNLLEGLLELGQQVIGLDNLSTGYRSNVDQVLDGGAEYSDQFTFIEGDIRDPETCRDACEGVDFVLHHAALASVPRSIEDPLLVNAVNVDGFVNMITAAKDARVQRFVYASSSAVYGDATSQPQVEEATGRPLSPYAATKAANETYAAAYQLTYGIEAIGLRYYNIFGRRQDPDGAYAAVIPRWIARLLSEQPCTVFGDGATTRDFCHVANVVQANLLAATVTDGAASARSYNVASGRSVTLNELFALITQQLSELGVPAITADPIHEPFRAGDIRHSSASIERARRMLGYTPTHDVAAGLSDALPWYVAQSRVALPIPS